MPSTQIQLTTEPLARSRRPPIHVMLEPIKLKIKAFSSEDAIEASVPPCSTQVMLAGEKPVGLRPRSAEEV